MTESKSQAADRLSKAAWTTSGEGHPRRWAILAVLVTSLLVVVLDNTILNIALPTIQRDLETTQSQLVWAVDSYILVFAALLFTWGVLGDRYGRKRILIIGLTIFGLASAVCAFAPTVQALIGFRAVMGIGGAAVLPVTLAIITVVFPPHERGKAIGMWAGSVGAAVALGPVLGGLLLDNPSWFSWLTGNEWGAVFLVNVPIVIVGFCASCQRQRTRTPKSSISRAWSCHSSGSFFWCTGSFTHLKRGRFSWRPCLFRCC